jgi:hypothetical protein
MIQAPDVSLARYLPECYPVAEVLDSVPVDGNKVVSFSRFAPNLLTLQNIAFAANTDVEIRVAIDRRGDQIKLYGPGTKDYKTGHESMMLTAKDSISMTAQSVGGTRTNESIRFNVNVRPRTLIDVYRLEGQAKAESWIKSLTIVDELKQALTTNLAEIIDQEAAGGMLPVRMDLLNDDIFNTFRDESILSGIFTTGNRPLPAVAARSSVPVCDPITAPEGHVAVVLGVAVDGQSVRDLSLYRDTFIYLDRYDGNQPELCRMDMAAMPGATAGVCGDYMRMFIPTLEQRIDVRLYSTTGIAAGQLVKVIYGIKKASSVNRLAWGSAGNSNLPSVNERTKVMDTKYSLTLKNLIGW